ncbi:ribosome silencing factor [Desulfococcus sp.]|uniref:ribosome silencing factor n=1 Tax=Desulfococcus sp. TaxID=2025834 RepID=UPI00359332A2
MTHDKAPDSTRPDANPSLDPYILAALAKKAAGLVVLDVGKLTSIADFFLICSGRSNRQVTAIAENIQAALKEQGIRPLSIEGLKTGHWVLMDYGHVIIHVFYDSVRSFYDLEGLWADARRIRTPDMAAAEAADASPPERHAGEDADADDYTAPEPMEVQDGI